MKTSNSIENQRKVRFAFTITRDLFLLRTLVNVNPWLRGEEQWDQVVKAFMTRGWDVTVRTIKGRLNKLSKLYKKQSIFKTGTEEERTKRADLLQEVEQLIDSGKSVDRVIIDRGTESEMKSSEIYTVDEEQGNDGINEGPNQIVPESQGMTSKKQLLVERQKADKERDNALKGHNSVEPPEPCGTRRKRARLTGEERLIQCQHHRIALENRRLDLEEKRESRLLEEGRKREEFAQSQLDIQKQQLALQQSLLDHQKRF